MLSDDSMILSGPEFLIIQLEGEKALQRSCQAWQVADQYFENRVK
jgi:hypothetical protein